MPSLFFNKVFLKSDSGTGVLQWGLRKFLRTPFFTQHLRWLLLWFILVASIVVTWVSWFSGHRFKLEAKDFFFHIIQRNFANFGVKILVLCSIKSLWSFYFSLFHSQLIYTCSKNGVVQSLVKTFPKRIYIYFFYSQVAYNCSN